MLELRGGLGRGGRVPKVVDEQGSHHAQAQLLVHDLQGFEDVHAAVCRREARVAGHRARGRARRDVAARGVTVCACDHGTPMLQALGEDVVRALVGHDCIHELDAVAREGLVPLQHADALPDLHPHWRRLVRFNGSSRGLLGDDMRIGGGAEEGEGGVLPLLAQALHDAITCHGDLHVQGTVQVRIVADRQPLARGHGGDPSGDFRGLGHQVATADLGERVVVALGQQPLPISAFRHREDDLARPILGLFQNAHQSLRSRDRDDVGTEAEQKVQWPHGRSCAQEHKVHVRQIQPFVLFPLQSLQRVDHVLLHRTILSPLIQLLAQVHASDLGVPLRLELVIWRAEHWRAIGQRQLTLAGCVFDPTHLCRVEGVRAQLLHGNLHRHLLVPIADELEGLLGGLETGASHGDAASLGLQALAHVLQQVLVVGEPPLLLLQDLRSRLFASRALRRCRCQHLLVRGHGRPIALLRLRPDNARQNDLRLVSFLEAALAVPKHVADHAWAARHVQEQSNQAQAVPQRIRKLPISSHADEGLEDLACDAAGVQHHEHGVAEVEDGIRHAAQQAAEVEQVANHLRDAPREGDEHKRPMALALGHPIQVAPHDEDSAADLERHDPDGAGHQADERVQNLQAHRRLGSHQHHADLAVDLSICRAAEQHLPRAQHAEEPPEHARPIVQQQVSLHDARKYPCPMSRRKINVSGNKGDTKS
mmetsp:Transcript_123909/g.396050  ORF Transcript_123909/g.396050 Transcript_123909/m.396050 type:complete len:707 (+) Transcript_123909:928-3048(+)